jgi:hypothetical protein
MMLVLAISTVVMTVLAGVGLGLGAAAYTVLRRQDAELVRARAEVDELRDRMQASSLSEFRHYRPIYQLPEDEGGVQYMLDAAGTGLMVEPYQAE